LDTNGQTKKSLIVSSFTTLAK